MFEQLGTSLGGSFLCKAVIFYCFSVIFKEGNVKCKTGIDYDVSAVCLLSVVDAGRVFVVGCSLEGLFICSTSSTWRPTLMTSRV